MAFFRPGRRSCAMAWAKITSPNWAVFTSSNWALHLVLVTALGSLDMPLGVVYPVLRLERNSSLILRFCCFEVGHERWLVMIVQNHEISWGWSLMSWTWNLGCKDPLLSLNWCIKPVWQLWQHFTAISEPEPWSDSQTTPALLSFPNWESHQNSESSIPQSASFSQPHSPSLREHEI